MKYLSNINRIHNCWNRFGKEYPPVSDIFLRHLFSCCQQLKVTKLPTRENFEHKRKNFGPAKYPRQKTEPTNAHKKKFGIHEIPTIKNFRPTKYPRENILDPWNTHDGTNDGAWPTRPTRACDPRNLAHSTETYITVSLFFPDKAMTREFQKISEYKATADKLYMWCNSSLCHILVVLNCFIILVIQN